VLQATAATVAKTATIAGATGYPGAAHILALRPAASGGSNTLTINMPTGVQQNDVMIASISVGPSNVTITPPAGWALVRRMNQASGTSNSLAVYSKLAGAGELGPYGWTFSAGHTGAAGGIQAFSGADPVIDIAEENGQNDTASVTAHATPSVNTTYSNTMIITSYGVGATSTWSQPPGMNETANLQGGSQAFEMSWVLQAAPASNISKTATSSSTGYGNAHILALRRVLGSFNAFETSTAAGAISGVLKTKVAGTSASAAVAALNAAKSAVAITYVGTMRVEILDASDNSAATDANGCRSTWTVIPGLTQDMTFTAADNGRKNVSGTISNSYRDVRLRMTSPAGAPDSIGCSSDNFAVRPSAITVSATDATWTTAGNTRTLNNTLVSGGTVHKAGQPFRVTAVAQPGTVTLYAGSPTVKTATCLLLGTMTGSPTARSPSRAGVERSGTRTNDSATHSEVGALTFELEDQNFAIVDAADSTTAERFIPQTGGTIQVGRFVPDRFRGRSGSGQHA